MTRFVHIGTVAVETETCLRILCSVASLAFLKPNFLILAIFNSSGFFHLKNKQRKFGLSGFF